MHTPHWHIGYLPHHMQFLDKYYLPSCLIAHAFFAVSCRLRDLFMRLSIQLCSHSLSITTITPSPILWILSCITFDTRLPRFSIARHTRRGLLPGGHYNAINLIPTSTVIQHCVLAALWYAGLSASIKPCLYSTGCIPSSILEQTILTTQHDPARL